MLPKEGGKSKKYFTAVDDVSTNVPEGVSVLRVPRDRIRPDKAVSKRDVEMYNAETGKFERMKKGGKVKKIGRAHV